MELVREGIEDGYAMRIHAPTCSLRFYQSLNEIFKECYPKWEYPISCREEHIFMD